MMDLISFPESSRVWIFQGDKKVPDDKVNAVFYRIQEFVQSWTSHQQALTATGSILHQRFIVFVVDEAKAGVSGCGIDKAVHFVQGLGHQLGIDFFDRNRYSYLEGDEVLHASAADFARRYEEGEISDHTLVFDNLVQNKGDFIQSWVKPLGDTWIKRVVLR